MNLRFDVWCDNYCPIENRLSNTESNSRYEKYLFLIRGEELYKVKSFPRKQIWKLVEYGQGRLLIVTGDYNYDNYVTLGYILTLIPWANYEECVDLTQE